MTLDTRVYVHNPVDYREVFVKCKRRGRHGSRGMEDCNDIDCREAADRLAREEINRRYSGSAGADRG